jgi:hypothetical protein
MNKEYLRLIRPLALFYIFSSALVTVFSNRLELYKIDIAVVIIANLFLFVVSLVNIYFQWKNINNPNPNAVIRGVMAATFLKLFVLGAAAIIYLLAAGEKRSVNAVFVGMGLYIFYTWLEVKISLRLNPKK